MSKKIDEARRCVYLKVGHADKGSGLYHDFPERAGICRKEDLEALAG